MFSGLILHQNILHKNRIAQALQNKEPVFHDFQQLSTANGEGSSFYWQASVEAIHSDRETTYAVDGNEIRIITYNYAALRMLVEHFNSTLKIQMELAETKDKVLEIIDRFINNPDRPLQIGLISFEDDDILGHPITCVLCHDKVNKKITLLVSNSLEGVTQYAAFARKKKANGELFAEIIRLFPNIEVLFDITGRQVDDNSSYTDAILYLSTALQCDMLKESTFLSNDMASLANYYTLPPELLNCSVFISPIQTFYHSQLTLIPILSSDALLPDETKILIEGVRKYEIENNRTKKISLVHWENHPFTLSEHQINTTLWDKAEDFKAIITAKQQAESTSLSQHLFQPARKVLQNNANNSHDVVSSERNDSEPLLTRISIDSGVSRQNVSFFWKATLEFDCRIDGRDKYGVSGEEIKIIIYNYAAFRMLTDHFNTTLGIQIQLAETKAKGLKIIKEFIDDPDRPSQIGLVFFENDNVRCHPITCILCDDKVNHKIVLLVSNSMPGIQQYMTYPPTKKANGELFAEIINLFPTIEVRFDVTGRQVDNNSSDTDALLYLGSALQCDMLKESNFLSKTIESVNEDVILPPELLYCAVFISPIQTFYHSQLTLIPILANVSLTDEEKIIIEKVKKYETQNKLTKKIILVTWGLYGPELSEHQINTTLWDKAEEFKAIITAKQQDKSARLSQNLFHPTQEAIQTKPEITYAAASPALSARKI